MPVSDFHTSETLGWYLVYASRMFLGVKQLQTELDQLSSKENRLLELQTIIGNVEKALMDESKGLSFVRQKSAYSLAKIVENHKSLSLAMFLPLSMAVFIFHFMNPPGNPGDN